MKYFLQHPIALFLALSSIFALTLLLLPINLFPGEIILQRGLVEITEQAPLSLSYFIGVGYEESHMTEVKDFYLLPQGYILAAILIVGIPVLAAYRVAISNSTKK